MVKTATLPDHAMMTVEATHSSTSFNVTMEDVFPLQMSATAKDCRQINNVWINPMKNFALFNNNYRIIRTPGIKWEEVLEI